jgi:hypothetical protein
VTTENGILTSAKYRRAVSAMFRHNLNHLARRYGATRDTGSRNAVHIFENS